MYKCAKDTNKFKGNNRIDEDEDYAIVNHTKQPIIRPTLSIIKDCDPDNYKESSGSIGSRNKYWFYLLIIP